MTQTSHKTFTVKLGEEGGDYAWKTHNHAEINIKIMSMSSNYTWNE